MHIKFARAIALATAVSLPALAAAEEEVVSPLKKGFYVAPMGSYLQADGDRQLDEGAGGYLGFGYRFGGLAVELNGNVQEADYEDGSNNTADFTSYGLNMLVFFGGDEGNFFGLLGAGVQEIDNLPGSAETVDDESFELGLGYILPLSIGRYDFGVRLDARMRHASRNIDQSTPGQQRSFSDRVANFGLHLPLGRRPAPVKEMSDPIRVVSAGAACSDGQDNDFDGLTDFPADPGCKSAEDNDETTAQCSDGIDNDNDGQIDLADSGCRDGDDNDELNACKAPGPGEIIDLSGCGAGDEIVLRGVHFEFDDARLTSNAQTILDDVAAALVKFQSMNIELGGHTDSFGSDSYNQKLSERRAESVKTYLINGGVAEDRITAIGFGESQPAATNETSEGRDENRRVTLKVIGE